MTLVWATVRSAACDAFVHVEAISPLPKADKQDRKRWSKSSRAAELTISSPYKRTLETSKAQAIALVGLRSVVGLQKRFWMCKLKDRNCPKTSSPLKDRNPKPIGQSQSACPQCKFVYVDANDPKADEDWIRCKKEVSRDVVSRVVR